MVDTGQPCAAVTQVSSQPAPSNSPRALFCTLFSTQTLRAHDAELDATIGPTFKCKRANTASFSPPVLAISPVSRINLHRYVTGLGLIPRVMSKHQGFAGSLSQPDNQKRFAEKWGQNPSMVTSFADGSKVSFEQAIVANA